MKRAVSRYTLLAIVAAVLSGCGPTYDDCSKSCGAEGACPSGMTCSNGSCTRRQACVPRGDAATDADAGSDSDTRMPDADAKGDGLDGDAPDGHDAADADDASDAHDAADADDAADAPDADDDRPDIDAPDADDDRPIDAPDASDDRPIDAPDADDDRPSIDVPDGNDDRPETSRPEAGDVPPPWTPAVIPNVVLWLEADRGIDAVPGGKIAEWRDQSPLHNDAHQTTPMSAPKLAADPFDGMPGVEFTVRTWMTISEDLSLRWGVLDFLVLVVYKSTARCDRSQNCILQQLFRKQEVDRPWRGPGLGIQPDGKIEVHLDHDAPNHWLASPATGYDGGRIHLVGAQRRSSWPSIRIDGADFPSGQPTVVVNMDAPGANVYFGAHGINPDPPIDFPFSGYVGAIVAVQGPISAAHLAELESYLMAKYGAVPGGPP